MKTRLLSLLVAVVLSVAVMPTTAAFAQEHGGGESATSNSPKWSDVKEVATWSIVGVATGAVVLGVFYTLKRKVGGFPENPTWVAPITIMQSKDFLSEDNMPDAGGHDSHAPAH